jgi:gentisate 1,2-dioxygenase
MRQVSRRRLIALEHHEQLPAAGRQPETVLFSVSDRPAQEALGIWREDRKPN